MTTGLAMMALSFLLRWFGGAYGDRLPFADGPLSALFWAVSKYPPSPVFLLATIGTMAVLLGLLRRLDYTPILAAAWRIPQIFGTTPLFFYIVHFYLLAIYPVMTADPARSGGDARWGLGTTYAVWLAGLVVLFPLCVWYRRLRLRYNRVLRYF